MTLLCLHTCLALALNPVQGHGSSYAFTVRLVCGITPCFLRWCIMISLNLYGGMPTHSNPPPPPPPKKKRFQRLSSLPSGFACRRSNKEFRLGPVKRWQQHKERGPCSCCARPLSSRFGIYYNTKVKNLTKWNV
jgi:hypothetical protein